MLTLYILKSINGVVCSDAYFNCAIDDHLINFNRDNRAIMKEIDNADYIDDSRYMSKYGKYAVSMKELSTGCKTCININSFKNQMFYIGECGINALSCIFKLTDGIMCTDAYFIVPEFNNVINVVDKINDRAYTVNNADMLENMLFSIFG